MAAHPQLIYQPVPEQQVNDWYNKDGGMYSAVRPLIPGQAVSAA